MECIICLETDAKKISVASPTLDSFLKLLEQSGQRAQIGHNSVMDFVDCTRDFNPEDLLASYHKVVVQTLQTPPKSSLQRNGTVTPLKANHLWLSEKQVDLPLQQLKWKKTNLQLAN